VTRRAFREAVQELKSGVVSSRKNRLYLLAILIETHVIFPFYCSLPMMIDMKAFLLISVLTITIKEDELKK
jgi:hypothetical protein